MLLLLNLLHVLSLVLVIDEPKSTFNCWKMFPRGGNNHNIYLRQIMIAKFLGRTLERNLDFLHFKSITTIQFCNMYIQLLQDLLLVREQHICKQNKKHMVSTIEAECDGGKKNNHFSQLPSLKHLHTNAP